MLCTAKGHFQFDFINVIGSSRVYIWSRVYIFRVIYIRMHCLLTALLKVLQWWQDCVSVKTQIVTHPLEIQTYKSLPRIVYNQMDFISLELNKTMPIWAKTRFSWKKKTSSRLTLHICTLIKIPLGKHISYTLQKF